MGILALFLLGSVLVHVLRGIRAVLTPVAPGMLRSKLSQLIGRLRIRLMAHCWCNALGGFGKMYYIWCISNPEGVSKALRTAADPSRHPLVFHCTSGKDRTGVVAVLLLHAAGVSRTDPDPPRKLLQCDSCRQCIAMDHPLLTCRSSIPS